MPKTNVIACQACKLTDEGCPRCGGFKVVLTQAECVCGTKYWVRPGAHTSYDGKEWETFDGLLMTDWMIPDKKTQSLKHGRKCARCPK